MSLLEGLTEVVTVRESAAGPVCICHSRCAALASHLPVLELIWYMRQLG